MMLAKGLCPRSALSRLLLILVASGLAAGCQRVDRTPPPAAEVLPAGGWQVVERLGDARYQAPASGWSPTMPASTLPDGSRVATGAGGRLILARPDEHITAGPASQFTLPDAAPGAALEQRAGSLRYRVAETTPGGLAVRTPFLEIEVMGTVFEVTVSATATEVSVQHGRVRIATLDGRRQIELGAGQSAYAGGATSAALAFRRAPGAPLEPVEALVLPAMQPRPGAREGRAVVAVRPAGYAGSRASTSGAAASAAAVPVAQVAASATAAAAPTEPRSQPPARPVGPAMTGAADVRPEPPFRPSIDGGRRMPPLSEAARSAVAHEPSPEPAPEDLVPTAFDRLSEGVVDGVRAVLPARKPAVDARRSF